jgi:hypothetical protein
MKLFERLCKLPCHFAVLFSFRREALVVQGYATIGPLCAWLRLWATRSACPVCLHNGVAGNHSRILGNKKGFIDFGLFLSYELFLKLVVTW